MNSGKEAIKVKKTAKSQFSLLGTVGDGVKSNIMTASNNKTMTIREFMKASQVERQELIA